MKLNDEGWIIEKAGAFAPAFVSCNGGVAPTLRVGRVRVVTHRLSLRALVAGLSCGRGRPFCLWKSKAS